MAKTRSPRPIVELKDVSKIYHLGEQTLYALRQVTFQISNGEFVAVIGASGSGKSTLLHMASLLDTPSQGHIIIDRQDTTNFNDRQRAKFRNQQIGFIFQQFNLLPKTSALDNVALPLVYANVPQEARQLRAQEMLGQVGLGDRLYSTPAQLSGGQQQRVAIARALVNRPSIIFADEPTGNLDSASGKEIISLLKQLNSAGSTIVLVTHDRQLSKIAPRLIQLHDGEIIDDRKQ